MNHDARYFVFAPRFLFLPFTSHFDCAAASLVRFSNLASICHNATAQREVGPLHVLHQLRGGCVGVLDEVHAGLDDFGQVVWRNVGRHSHGDTLGSIDQQVRIPSRQNNRFFARCVVVGTHVDSVVTQLVHELLSDLRQLRFGVSFGRSSQAHDGSKVTLTINQRTPQREVLRHPNQRVVNRNGSVRVKVTGRVTRNLCTLARLRVGRESQPLIHHVHDAPLHGFQSVTNIRQCARCDDRQSVVEIPPARFFADADKLDVIRIVPVVREQVHRSARTIGTAAPFPGGLLATASRAFSDRLLSATAGSGRFLRSFSAGRLLPGRLACDLLFDLLLRHVRALSLPLSQCRPSVIFGRLGYLSSAVLPDIAESPV